MSFTSIRYRILFLLSDKIISSSADPFFSNPFFEDKRYLLGLFNFDFIFLQHGITKDCISPWIHRLNRDINLFVTAGIPEYQSLLDPVYGYSTDTVRLLGFPRYDRLIRLHKTRPQPERTLLLMPTWRKGLTEGIDLVRQHNGRFPHFRESEYYRFYNSLINNPVLCQFLKERCYRGILCLHPAFIMHSNDFQSNEVFQVYQGFANYQSLFLNASLLITDYSSVAFDFALLQKPVIYTQFDQHDFFSHHSYTRGYFNYERHGFGPVCKDLQSTITYIHQLIEHNCSMQSHYRLRVNNFFAFFDDHNCERVFLAIISQSRTKLQNPFSLTFFHLIEKTPYFFMAIRTMGRRPNRYKEHSAR